MLTVVLLAGAVAVGAHPALVGLVGLAVWRPWWFLGVVALWAVWARSRRGPGPSPDDEAAFLRGMAAELRAGASLRWALGAAAARVPNLQLAKPVRLAAAGLPAPAVAGALGESLPVNGRLASAAFRLASATGARAADVIGGLAVRAAEAGELTRERRSLTAQTRLSAWVVGGAPLALLALLAATGRGVSFTDLGPAGVVVVAVGVTLELAGALVVWLMIRRARR